MQNNVILFNAMLNYHLSVLPGKKFCIPLASSFLSRTGQIPGTSLTGTRLPLMSFSMTSGSASHWGKTLLTCRHTEQNIISFL